MKTNAQKSSAPKVGDLRIVIADSRNYELQTARKVGKVGGVATEKTGTIEFSHEGWYSNLETLCLSAMRDYPRWMMAQDILSSLKEGKEAILDAITRIEVREKEED